MLEEIFAILQGVYSREYYHNAQGLFSEQFTLLQSAKINFIPVIYTANKFIIKQKDQFGKFQTGLFVSYSN